MKSFERDHCRDVGGADPHGDAGGFTIGELALHHRGKVFLGRAVVVVGVIGELFPDSSDGRCFPISRSGMPSAIAARQAGKTTATV